MAKMLITKSTSSAHVQEPEARTGHSRTVHALTGLMENIAAVRAEFLCLENLAAELRTRLHTEAYPLQSRMVEIRLETWRVLGRHYQSKQVKKKTRRILAQILEDYAFFLEDVLKVDMDGELRAVLGRGLFPPEAEALFKDFSDFLDSDADSVSDSGSSDGSSGEADAASRTTSERSRGRPRKQKAGTADAAAPKAKTV